MHPAPALAPAPAPSGTDSPDVNGPSPSEQTPLLSRASSSTLRDASPRRASNTPSTAPKLRIGVWRGVSVAFSLWLLIFLQASNMSGMTMVQGKIAEDLHVYESAMWFTSAYLIPMSSLSPVAGRLATIFPPRSLVLPVAAAIAAGSLICGRATTFAAFITGRVIAGLGGAGVLTLAVILVLELTSQKTRGVYVGLVNAGFTLGVSFGAIVYGALLPAIGWRPLFLVQVPFSVVAGLGVYWSIPAMASEDKARKGSVTERLARIDYLGASLLTLTIVVFLYGLAGDIQPLPLVLSLASLLLFLLVEFRIAGDPIIPVKVLSSRGVLFSCLAQLGLMSARWTVLFYAPIFMLAVKGAAPAAAGSILIPTNLGFGLGGVVVGWWHVRRSGSFWLPSVVSVAFFSASLYALSFVGTPSAPVAAFIAIVLVNGLATGAGLNYTLAHILHLSHEDTQYVTTSLLGTFRGFGGSFGTAIGGGIFYRFLRSILTSGFLDLDDGEHLSAERKQLVSRLLGSPGVVFGGELNEAERGIAVNGYAGASRGVWQAAAALGVVMIAIQAATGWTAPETEETDVEGIDEDEARAHLTENEGFGEA